MAADPLSGAPNRSAIAIGTSMGGSEALAYLLAHLPPTLPASLFVVRHVGTHAGGALVRTLGKVSEWAVTLAAHNQAVQCGTVYVAPPDVHMLVRAGRIRLARGPRENRARPAIDPLFRSVGVAYQGRAIGVILSGMLDDGSAGLAALHRCGGMAIVEDPATAAFPEMPRNAKEAVPDATVVPLEGLAAVLARAVQEPAPDAPPLPADILFEVDVADCGLDDIARQEQHGTLVPQVCPDCGGPLWQMHDEALPRFRCHTGHAFSSQVLLDQQRRDLERHMWGALRALRERARLLRRLAQRAHDQGSPQRALEHEREAADAEADGLGIRRYLLGTAGAGAPG